MGVTSPDPLPTNCVADWVCAGHRQLSGLRHSRRYHNLAVFYSSCCFNCIYCQNWHFRGVDPATSEGLSAHELVACANDRTFCVCYFGGDPASQMPHALASARYLAERGVVVCWETAGSQHPKLMNQAARLSLQTGGTVKFDLKALDEGLHIALTGASTLLVPGYVTPDEVGRIAHFIADINPHIPYALLGFAPNFYVPDLPCTSARHAEEALAAAQSAGLKNVRIGNRHLLSHDY